MVSVKRIIIDADDLTEIFRLQKAKKIAKGRHKRARIICPICNHTGWAVRDHDHGSARTRGVICDSCNKGLGFFRDEPDILIRASEYLKYWKSKDLFGDRIDL